MSDQNIDFESTIKSSRKLSSRRRKDRIEDDNIDSILDLDAPRTQNRRGSNATEGISLDNLPENRTNANEEINEPSLTQSQNFRSRRKNAENNFSVETSQDVPDSTAFSRKLNLKEMNQIEENEIPEIPDLEEIPDPVEDIAFQVAEAPDVQVHQIATFKELDKEFFREKAFQFLEGNIDVSLLHCGLSTETQIAEEEDVIWEWNKLFTEVVSALTANTENEPKSTFDVPIENARKTTTDASLNLTSRRDRKFEDIFS
ncbi:intraflagellar transport 43 -like protein [Brachionus plicatilis]|uniref:Intraflagellar transport 43-like protein n=1 Tax=Brachionus plicatilis TaxID=10195 RepID=A0A3M7S8S1_BRAPC|nr:intraflagellar transport 43 -like protein [Brachionus plicatilis]